MAYIGIRPAGISNAAEVEVTGDLTVDTNTLHVDATNNRVGVGTTAPGVGLEVTDSICVGRQTAAAQSKFVGIGGSGGTFVTGTTGGGYTEYEVKSDQDTLIHFVTNDQGNSHARRVSILPTGGITFNGDTAAANALDDYEQGTWTPNVGGDTTYHHQYGSYVKIGRHVTVWFRVKINAKNTPTASFFLQGLPYANDFNSNIGGTGLTFYFSNIATSTIMMTNRIDGGGSTINFTGNGASGTTAQFVNIEWVANNAEVQGMVTYMT